MSLKMYVLIKEDMTPAQQAVQAGHALSQFGAEHPRAFLDWQQDSNILIYLSVESIAWWKQVLEDGGFKHSVFTEPALPVVRTTMDFSYWEKQSVETAIAVAPDWTCQYVLFKDLPLALSESRSKAKRWWWR